MKNPLLKRIPRELRKNLGKYLAMFLFLTVMTGFISGFLVAGGSMQRSHQESFDKYNIEDGHIDLAGPANALLFTRAKSLGLQVSEQFYKDVLLNNAHTLRLYKNRTSINLPALFTGTLPRSANDIALDRLYMQNNGLAPGDTVEVDGQTLTICGSVALSDYSALFKSQTDLLFDAQRFSVALVTDACFNAVTTGDLHHVYAWRSSEAARSGDAKDLLPEELVNPMMKSGLIRNISLREHNRAISFAGDDFARDKSVILTMLYITITVLAFIFAFTTKNTIAQEAQTIGSLRACGYTTFELFWHYLYLPLLIVLSSSLLGNALGYSLFKNLSVSLYYNSYSLPPYVTIWNMEAFVLTTLVPAAIVLLVVSLIVHRSLRLSPQHFLRGDLRRHRKKGSLPLPNLPVFTRLRLRVILQNSSSYVVLLIGIYLASLMLLFGLGLNPMLDYHRDQVIKSKLASHQYLLKMPVPTTHPEAEGYLAVKLDMPSGDTVTVYGIAENSRYLKAQLPADDDGVLISNGMQEKFRLKSGDSFSLGKKHSETSFSLTAQGVLDYPANFAVFMKQQHFLRHFGSEVAALPGYFSNSALTDIPDNMIATIIREADLTSMADQLSDSTGKMFHLFSAFALVIYILLVYLLAGQVLEKNKYSIAMLRVLGYQDRELISLFHLTTGLVLVFALFISLPLCAISTEKLMRFTMQSFNGWMFYHVTPHIYLTAFAMGLLSYLPAYFLQHKKLRKASPATDLRQLE